MVIASAPDAVENRGKARQAFGRGVSADVLVPLEDGLAQGVTGRNDRTVEVTLCPCAGGVLVGPRREGVQRLAVHAAKRGDQVGADALGHVVGRRGDFRVKLPRTSVRKHRYAGHGFDTPGDHHIFPA